MKELSIILIITILFIGCSDTTPKKRLDGKKLIENKCASCHNLNMPPKIYLDELAPPMMAAAFHIANGIDANNESQRIPKAVEFVKDYVINPSEEKSFCDKDSLNRYGLMPSQKDNLTLDELDAIARYMFRHYTQENLSEAQEAQERLNAMPTGERLALQNNCLTCHRIDKDLVGPSFEKIAIRYKDNIGAIKESIKNGSSKKYKESRGAMMPAFKNLSDSDIKEISEWILKAKIKTD